MKTGLHNDLKCAVFEDRPKRSSVRSSLKTRYGMSLKRRELFGHRFLCRQANSDSLWQALGVRGPTGRLHLGVQGASVSVKTCYASRPSVSKQAYKVSRKLRATFVFVEGG